MIFLAIGALAGCSGNSGGPAKTADEVAKVPVEVASASHRAIDASYSGTASLEAEREADVVAKTGGVLLKLQTEEGRRVHAGDVLARLDDASPRLSLAKAQATLRKLESDYGRAHEMFAKKLLSQEEHDKLRFDLENERAAFELAQLEQSYTTIVAPIDGVVGKRMVKEGNLIQLNQTLFHIVNLDTLLGVLNVPERELNTLKPGQSVTLHVDALPGQAFEGSVQRISPVVDAASGTFRVTCQFRDTTGRLKPGMFGRIEAVYDRKQDALAVPRAALIEEDGQTAVFVVVPAPPPAAPVAGKADAKAEAKPDAKLAKKDAEAKPAGPAFVVQRRVVKIGYSDSEFVEVREGLKEGDRVITVGRNAVREGTEVQVLEAVQ